MKHIPKNNVILKTQDMNQNKTYCNYNETVIYRLYFKVIIRLNEFEIKWEYYSFIIAHRGMQHV